MRFLVNFERATADFDLARAEAAGAAHAAVRRRFPLPRTLGYERRGPSPARRRARKTPELRATLAEAATVLDLLARERQLLA